MKKILIRNRRKSGATRETGKQGKEGEHFFVKPGMHDGFFQKNGVQRKAEGGVVALVQEGDKEVQRAAGPDKLQKKETELQPKEDKELQRAAETEHLQKKEEPVQAKDDKELQRSAAPEKKEEPALQKKHNTDTIQAAHVEDGQ